MERTITIQQIKDVAQEAYNLYKDNTDGKNADYIPYLANIDPKLFGISICLMNGEIIQLGDSQYRFGIESVSKVLTAILVLRQYGPLPITNPESAVVWVSVIPVRICSVSYI